MGCFGGRRGGTPLLLVHLVLLFISIGIGIGTVVGKIGLKNTDPFVYAYPSSINQLYPVAPSSREGPTSLRTTADMGRPFEPCSVAPDPYLCVARRPDPDRRGSTPTSLFLTSP